MKIYRSEQLFKEDASIHIFSDECKQGSMPVHLHDFIEIIYITDGNAEQTVNGETYHVRRGDLLFINYGSTHSFTACESFSFINICFKPEVMVESVITPENAFAVLQLTAFDEIRRESEDGMLSFRGEERNEAEMILHAMAREYAEQKHSWKTVLKSYMNVLVSLIVRKLMDVDATGTDDIWRELSDYIDSNLDSDLTLSGLAGKCFYNPSYFSRAFKKRFNMSLTEYLNHRKIESAKTLALSGTLSDEEIATRVGFSYKRSFYRVFRRVEGVSFAEYKKNGKKK
ncbi:MAG: helix-turn-helix domain-containing protein [Clostridia bacterium]|nr:helix-turn-helix domain-containing protein [Clostridia bacterium]